jgi:hypothetical protein
VACCYGGAVRGMFLQGEGGGCKGHIVVEGLRNVVVGGGGGCKGCCMCATCSTADNLWEQDK